MSLCEQFPRGNEIFSLMDQQAREEGIPLSGTFELTPRCNFDCKMCYVHLKPDRIPLFGRELNAGEWISMGEQARDLGMLQLCITGGEPILHPDFAEIYEALSQMGFFITLQTNGSTLTPGILQLLADYPPQQAKLTLYGANDAVYEQVCGVKQGFTRVNQGIEALQSLGIPVLLVSTIIKPNLHDVQSMAQYAWSHHIPWIPTTAVHESVRGAETDARAVAIDEQDATDYRADVREMIEHPGIREGSKPCDYCRGYRNSFWITWNGQVRFCSFMNEPQISVLEQPLARCWQELLDYEEALQWPKECQTCEIRHICRRCAGMLASMSGRADRVDPAYCEKMKRYVREVQEGEQQ